MEMEHCHFWLARFRDEEAIESYFSERDHRAAGEPISHFARDQEEVFYDHDFVFAEFDPNGQLDALCDRIRLPDQTRKQLLDVTEEEYNTIVAADEGEFAQPQSVDGDPRLRYIGCFPCWPRNA